MLKSIYALLARANALLAALTDEEVRSHLAASGFPLDELSQGNSRVERAQSVLAACAESRVRMRTLTEAADRSFGASFREVAVLRFVALRAFRHRSDLVEGLRIGPRVLVEEPQPTDGTPTAVGTAGVASPASMPAKKKRGRAGERVVVRFLTWARAFLAAVIDDETAIALLAPYGYSRERLSPILARLDALASLEREQESAKRAFHAASAASEEEEREFRRWNTPWRKLVRQGLLGRPDLMKRVGVA